MSRTRRARIQGSGVSKDQTRVIRGLVALRHTCELKQKRIQNRQTRHQAAGEISAALVPEPAPELVQPRGLPTIYYYTPRDHEWTRDSYEEDHWYWDEYYSREADEYFYERYSGREPEPEPRDREWVTLWLEGTDASPEIDDLEYDHYGYDLDEWDTWELPRPEITGPDPVNVPLLARDAERQKAGERHYQQRKRGT